MASRLTRDQNANKPNPCQPGDLPKCSDAGRTEASNRSNGYEDRRASYVR